MNTLPQKLEDILSNLPQEYAQQVQLLRIFLRDNNTTSNFKTHLNLLLDNAIGNELLIIAVLLYKELEEKLVAYFSNDNTPLTTTTTAFLAVLIYPPRSSHLLEKYDQYRLDRLDRLENTVTALMAQIKQDSQALVASKNKMLVESYLSLQKQILGHYLQKSEQLYNFSNLVSTERQKRDLYEQETQTTLDNLRGQFIKQKQDIQTQEQKRQIKQQQQKYVQQRTALQPQEQTARNTILIEQQAARKLIIQQYKEQHAALIAQQEREEFEKKQPLLCTKIKSQIRNIINQEAAARKIISDDYATELDTILTQSKTQHTAISQKRLKNMLPEWLKYIQANIDQSDPVDYSVSFKLGTVVLMDILQHSSPIDQLTSQKYNNFIEALAQLLQKFITKHTQQVDQVKTYLQQAEHTTEADETTVTCASLCVNIQKLLNRVCDSIVHTPVLFHTQKKIPAAIKHLLQARQVLQPLVQTAPASLTINPVFLSLTPLPTEISKSTLQEQPKLYQHAMSLIALIVETNFPAGSVLYLTLNVLCMKLIKEAFTTRSIAENALPIYIYFLGKHASLTENIHRFSQPNAGELLDKQNKFYANGSVLLLHAMVEIYFSFEKYAQMSGSELQGKKEVLAFKNSCLKILRFFNFNHDTEYLPHQLNYMALYARAVISIASFWLCKARLTHKQEVMPLLNKLVEIPKFVEAKRQPNELYGDVEVATQDFLVNFMPIAYLSDGFKENKPQVLEALTKLAMPFFENFTHLQKDNYQALLQGSDHGEGLKLVHIYYLVLLCNLDNKDENFAPLKTVDAIIALIEQIPPYLVLQAGKQPHAAQEAIKLIDRNHKNIGKLSLPEAPQAMMRVLERYNHMIPLSMRNAAIRVINDSLTPEAQAVRNSRQLGM